MPHAIDIPPFSDAGDSLIRLDGDQVKTLIDHRPGKGRTVEANALYFDLLQRGFGSLQKWQGSDRARDLVEKSPSVYLACTHRGKRAVWRKTVSPPSSLGSVRTLLLHSEEGGPACVYALRVTLVSRLGPGSGYRRSRLQHSRTFPRQGDLPICQSRWV